MWCGVVQGPSLMQYSAPGEAADLGPWGPASASATSWQQLNWVGGGDGDRGYDGIEKSRFTVCSWV